ncbi:unnamed protein product, partial [Polarella glacialis]
WEQAILQRSIVLQEVDTGVFCGSKDDLYKPPGARGVFGGQTIAQSLHAAILSAPKEYLVHSLHGYFLLGGDPDRNILFHVEKLREGGSFVSRSVEARQRGKAIFTCMVQFHKPEPSLGLEVARTMPAVKGPEGLKSDRDLVVDLLKANKLNERMREFYTNYLTSPARAERRLAPPLEGADPFDPVERYWTKVTGRMSDDQELHLICLAYMSDMGQLTPAYVPFGGMQRNLPSMMVSLDHSMWFHSRNFRADDWLLFEMRCMKATGARILSFCQVWTQSGELVCSCTQEGLARHKEPLRLPSTTKPASKL